MSSGCKVSRIVEENNQNKQGGRKLKTVYYCLQYGNILFWAAKLGAQVGAVAMNSRHIMMIYLDVHQEILPSFRLLII